MSRVVRKSDVRTGLLDAMGAASGLSGTRLARQLVTGIRRLPFLDDMVRKGPLVKAKMTPVATNDLTGVYIGGWRWQWEVMSPSWIWTGHTALYRIAPGATTAELVAAPSDYGGIQSGVVVDHGDGAMVVLVGRGAVYPDGSVLRSDVVPPQSSSDYTVASDLMTKLGGAARAINWSSATANVLASDSKVIVGLIGTKKAGSLGLEILQHQVRSTDGGATWTVAAAATHSYGAAIATNAMAYSHGRFYRWVRTNSLAGVTFKIDYSEDAGLTWVTLNTVLTDVRLADVNYLGNGRWLVYDSNGANNRQTKIYETTNDFATRATLASPPTGRIYQSIFPAGSATRAVFTTAGTQAQGYPQLYYRIGVPGSYALQHTLIPKTVLGLPATSPYGTPSLLAGGDPSSPAYEVSRLMQDTGEFVMAHNGYALVSGDDLLTYRAVLLGPLLYSYTSNGFDHYEPSFYAHSGAFSWTP